jgi:ferredoxin-type protein NapG
MSGIMDFLKRVFVNRHNPLINDYSVSRLRPPGAVVEHRFMALCIRCNRCVEVCPYNSIKRAGIGATIGTPYIFPETKACYLCMACCRLCPTGALDRNLTMPSKVTIGKAKIDPSICYSHLFLEHDVIPNESLDRIGALCNTCYNVCPLQDEAISLKDNLYPAILDGCVGCGICVERCPTRPKRAVNVIPTGMGRVDEAGFYFRKAKSTFDISHSKESDSPGKPLRGERLIEQKFKIDSSGKEPKFEFPYQNPKSKGDWD